MILYYVHWIRDVELCKGKGRVKQAEWTIDFSVLCRNSSDAMQCLDYVFREKYSNSNGLTLSDGVITLKRGQIDSRGFSPTYLLADGLKEPIVMSNLKSNALRAHKIFGI